jgi:transcriptional regulator with XRE-family HTH domain
MNDAPHPLKAWRESRKPAAWTQAQLAAAADTDQPTVSAIESGQRFPSADLAFRFQDVTSIDARRLIRRKARRRAA